MSFRTEAGAKRSDPSQYHALIRILIEQETWKVPITVESGGPPRVMLFGLPEGGQMVAFSDSGDLQRWVSSRTGDQRPLFTEVSGVGLTGMLDDAVVDLCLEAGTDAEVHYPRERFQELRMWAAASEVESILQGTDLPDPWRKVREFPSYFVLFSGDGESMVMAPDSEGRRLVGICTAPDTIAMFERRMRDGAGVDVQVRTMDGKSLFELIDGLPVDGVVFNPSGPVAPKALAKAIAQVVLHG